jgi:hypothetical protein
MAETTYRREIGLGETKGQERGEHNTRPPGKR